MQNRVLAGRFRLTEMLGQGGMGSVWRAQHLELGTDVAVKLMAPSLTSQPEGMARFRREAQAAASLKSPNVVQVFDYGVDGDTPYIAMELLRGESLAKRLERLHRLPANAMASILTQVARALGKAHDAGIVHRDLKPENIFIVEDEDGEIVKVLDFGIAKRTGTDNFLTGGLQTQTGAMLGTPYYMSPEQAAGKKDVDHRSDIWSFGVIACESLVGRHLFEADTLGGLVLAICTEPIPVPSALGSVPAGFDTWLARCVARDRQVRFQSIREAAMALDAACRGSAMPYRRQDAYGVTPAPSAWQPMSGELSRSTQSGPTSITVQPITVAQQYRRLKWSLAGAVLFFGASAYFWLGPRPPNAVELTQQTAVTGIAATDVPSQSAASAVRTAASTAIESSPAMAQAPPTAVRNDSMRIPSRLVANRPLASAVPIVASVAPLQSPPTVPEPTATGVTPPSPAAPPAASIPTPRTMPQTEPYDLAF